MPLVDEATRMRLRVCEWLAEQLLGNRATLVDHIQSVPALKIFRELGAGIPTDLNDAMDSLCRFVGETTPRTYRLSGVQHPALLIYWWVQAHLVSRLSPALCWAYREIFRSERIYGRPCPATGCEEFWARSSPYS